MKMKKLTAIAVLGFVLVAGFSACAVLEPIKKTASTVGKATSDFVFDPAPTPENPDAEKVSPEAETVVRTATSFLGPIGTPIATLIIGALTAWGLSRRKPAAVTPPPAPTAKTGGG